MEMAAGVIASKARSMLGNQLQESDYIELSHKHNVAEICAYLKGSTSYADALKDVRENHIHRGQLEDLLVKESFRRLLKLFRYSESSQRAYFQLHMQKIEIELLLSRIRVLISQSFDSAIVELPIFLKPYTSYDLTKLGSVSSYDDLLDVVEHLRYYEVLKPFHVKKGQESQIAYAQIETALQKDFYAHGFEVIKHVLKGENRKRCYALLASQAELTNIEKIYRMKKYFNARENEIEKVLIPIHYRISQKKMEELIASTTSQFIKLVAQSPYHLSIDDKEDVNIEQEVSKYIYATAKKQVYFAQHAAIISSSYLVLMQQELQNIVRIIEGVRYQVAPEQIESMLIY